ncbi:hypothetical protein [Pseudactinotalea sp. HY158]|uniref:hypothetical protein n=1 Tax=Pseudactinotalea sp. HY158 TaxID=2654547 RepID=UPI001E406399|nr:hypothetical protein [Pseudactinotalea sp. HY158]
MVKRSVVQRGVVGRAVVGAVGGVMLVGVGTAAMAAHPDAEDTSAVEIGVEIESVGALTMTVDGTESTLVEDGSTEEFRQFTGELPNVTVTDDRSDAPEGVYWYVVGQASDFVGDAGQAPIGPEHLGWTPAMVTESSSGAVGEGQEVGTVLDAVGEGPGLAGEELFLLTLDSQEAQAENGSWTANADLVLRTETDVAPGSYSSVLTLSLFEDGQ